MLDIREQVKDNHFADETQRQQEIQRLVAEMQGTQEATPDFWDDEPQEAQQPAPIVQQRQQTAITHRPRQQQQIAQYERQQAIQYVPIGMQQQRDLMPLYVGVGLAGFVMLCGSIMMGIAGNTANQPNQSIQTLAEANAVLADAAAVPRIQCPIISFAPCGVPADNAQAQQQKPQNEIPQATQAQIQQWQATLTSNYTPDQLAAMPPKRMDCINNPGLAEAYYLTTGVKGCSTL